MMPEVGELWVRKRPLSANVFEYPEMFLILEKMIMDKSWVAKGFYFKGIDEHGRPYGSHLDWLVTTFKRYELENKDEER